MTVHAPLSPEPRPNAGGATVADLRAMDGAQALAVLLFRDAFDSPAGTARVRHVFCEALGPSRGARADDDWSELVRLLVQDARRPLMRHALTCTCVGADEAVVAQVLTLFAIGEREDAILTLALLIPGDRVVLAATAAERAGRAVLATARHHARHGPPGSPRHLH